MTKKLIILTMVLTLSACVDEQNTRRILEQEGYTEIEITGFRPFSCSEDDAFKSGFTATNPSGRSVSGAVCSGFFKGHTIRFD